jgi:2-polyprenyl-3-methyl-5-hydroxy-6-metoxy-1,4-benzoquinol methylase
VSCCPPQRYDRAFGKRGARRDARRYRRRGLDGTSRRIFDLLGERGVEGFSVLEIGGGVGAIQVELLRAGAERAVNLELSPAYEETAGELLREAGLEGRVERRLGDIVQEEDLAGPADTVVMNRVVCCYPDPDALVGAAAERTRRFLVMSFPRERRLTRVVVAAANLVARVLRWDFRAWVHPHAAILAAAERQGLRLAGESRDLVWRIAALERPAS